jgi:hypothetical protein
MGQVYASIARDLGWTWPQIDEFLWADYLDLADSWRRTPPLHVTVASLATLFGLKGEEQPPRATVERQREIIQMWGA